MKILGVVSGMIALITGIMLSTFTPIEAKDEALRQGLILYSNGDYVKAIEALDQGHGDPLIIGNAYYKLGQSDQEAMMDSYDKALETYWEAMILDEDRIELKYNYEWVLKEKQKQEEEQDQEEQDQEEQDQEEQDQEDQDQDGQEDQEEKENQDGEGDEEKENQESQEDSEEDSDGNDEQGEPQQSEQQQSEEGLSQEESAINQILQMLEQQEEESLKNNQGIKVQGQGDGNDW